MHLRLHERAPGKVNLCLLLGGPRADGRHRVVTLLVAVSLADELTLELAHGGHDEVLCPGVEGENLVAAALAGLRQRGWGAPPVRIAIQKRVPVAAGMGGGSADAAAALRLARALGAHNPRWAVAQRWLDELAPALGADVPAALAPGAWLGTGAGELVEAVGPLAPLAFVIVAADQPLSTAAVYRQADRLGLARPDDELDRWETRLRAALAAGSGAALPEELIINDLEPAARALCPAVGKALEALRAAGAPRALVCGSGATCAGIWWGADADARAHAAAALLRSQGFATASAQRPLQLEI